MVSKFKKNMQYERGKCPCQFLKYCAALLQLLLNFDATNDVFKTHNVVSKNSKNAFGDTRYCFKLVLTLSRLSMNET